MSLLSYMSRLKRDYRNTFGTESGRHVLVHLYTKLGGNRTSITQKFDPIELAFNEGKRFAWLVILDHLKENDQDMRGMLEEHIAERKREEQSQ